MGRKSIPIAASFSDGTEVMDYYSGKIGKVSDGQLSLDTPFDIFLVGVSPGQ